MKYLTAITIIISIAILSGVLAYGVNRWSVARMTELKNQAYDECAKVSMFSFEQPDGTGKITRSQEPLKSVYKTCIEDKGYQTTITL